MRTLAASIALLVASPAFAAPLPAGHTSEIQIAPRPSLPVRGPRFAPLTIDVGVPLPLTQQAIDLAPLLRRQLAAGDVRIVYHLFANSSPWSMSTVEALLEAAREERFLELLDALYARGPSLLSTEELTRIGREAGLIGPELAAALADHRHRAEALRVTAETRATGRGGAELAINGTRLPPRLSERDLGVRIADERRRARAALEAGVPITRLYEKLTREREEQGISGVLRGDELRRITLDLSGAPTRGPAIAPVTIVLLSSFVCSSCPELGKTMRKIEARFPGQVRFVWRNLPTSVTATIAAEFGAAAHAQHGFWAFHDLALPSRHSISRNELLAFARDAHLDVARIDKEVRDGVYRAQIQREVDESRRFGLTWPGLALINGQPVPSNDFALYERLIQRELDTGLLEKLVSH